VGRLGAIAVAAGLLALASASGPNVPHAPWALGFAALAAESPKAADRFDAILVRHRKVIALAQGTPRSADAGRATAVARIIYHEQRHLLEELSAALVADLLQSGGGAGARAPSAVQAFLDWLERDPDLWDADKLAFRDLLFELFSALDAAPAAREHLGALGARIADDRKALDQIQALYGKEMERVMSQLRLRGMPLRRESWDKYLAFVRARYPRERVFGEYDPDGTLLPAARGTGAAAPRRDEINGSRLPRKTVVLTFDDGPHHRYTDQVLALLKKHGAHAVFFQVGSNVGSLESTGAVSLSAKADVSRRILASGSLVANHSLTHALLTKLAADKVADEIKDTNEILRKVAGDKPALFRPPYGAHDAVVEAAARSENMKTIMWNVDSMDWADPIPQSIANRVLEEIDGAERGIVLFHDIHLRSVEALDGILASLRQNGYRFASWNGESFVVAGASGQGQPARVAARPPAEPFYRESWAAIVGVDDYEKWPRLRYAVNDAKAIRDILVRRYRFKEENIFTLYNQEATRKNILSLLGDKLADPQRVQRDDRVFVFFAGHGTTRKLASGRDLGYIVPVDADTSNFHGQAISMTNFRDVAEAIPAKHLLFVMDSCYSGLGLTRGAATPAYVQDLSRRTARQLLTAGGAGQQVADGGPNGHSVFTWTLLQALEGSGDLNGDGYITASELAAYAVPIVASISQQTPAFGNIPGSEGGDFVFDRNRESEDLSAVSAQLDDEAIDLNATLERLRSEIMVKRERNQKLQQEIKALRERAGAPAAAPVAAAPDPAESGARLNERGLALYKEKRYPEALESFLAAARLDPADAQVANNVGFVYFKLGQHAEALAWIRKSLLVDPNRTVAYRNLGDAYDAMGRTAEARSAYEKYLSLNPPPAAAATVKQKLDALR
jgi:peptidoglycan/xylan/chitin deacetylase (PgdA/CDA1 family)/uncharacterized caspase-like protein